MLGESYSEGRGQSNPPLARLEPIASPVPEGYEDEEVDQHPTTPVSEGIAPNPYPTTDIVPPRKCSWVGWALIGVILSSVTLFMSIPPGSRVFRRLYVNTWAPAGQERVTDILSGFQHVLVLTTALDLGIFEFMKDRPSTPAALATHIEGLNVEGASILLGVSVWCY